MPASKTLTILPSSQSAFLPLEHIFRLSFLCDAPLGHPLSLSHLVSSSFFFLCSFLSCTLACSSNGRKRTGVSAVSVSSSSLLLPRRQTRQVPASLFRIASLCSAPGTQRGAIAVDHDRLDSLSAASGEEHLQAAAEKSDLRSQPLGGCWDAKVGQAFLRDCMHASGLVSQAQGEGEDKDEREKHQEGERD